jgi:hypothetical protein
MKEKKSRRMGRKSSERGYNPEGLGPEVLAQMPRDTRLLRDEAERKAFEAEEGLKSDLYRWIRTFDKWQGGMAGNETAVTYCTTRPLGWDKADRQAAEEKSGADGVKPPMGIMPERMWKMDRAVELMKCIGRYEALGTSRVEWWDELRRLLNEVHVLR